MSAAAGRALAPALGAAALGAAALLLGAAFALGAYRLGPGVALGAVLVPALFAVAIARPEIGVAAALVLPAVSVVVPAAGRLSLLTTALVAALVVVVAWRGGVRSARGGVAGPLLLAVLAFVAVALVGFALSDTPGEAQALLRGLVTGAGLLFVASQVVTGRAQLAWVLGAAAVAAALVGANVVVAGGDLGDGFVTGSGALVARASGGFSQPNQLAGFLVLLVPLCVGGALLERRFRLLYALAAALAVYGVYASFSRSALVALLVVPLVFVSGRRLLLVVPLLAVLTLTLTPGLLRERFATLDESGSELATRTDIWRTAAAIWQDDPLLGVGLGDFPAAYAKSDLPGKQFLPNTLFAPPPHAHDVWLQMLAELGIAGLLSLAAIVALALAMAGRLRGSPDRTRAIVGHTGLAVLGVFLVHNLFDVTLLQTETALFLWATIGVLAGLARTTPQVASTRRR